MVSLKHYYINNGISSQSRLQSVIHALTLRFCFRIALILEVRPRATAWVPATSAGMT